MSVEHTSHEGPGSDPGGPARLRTTLGLRSPLPADRPLHAATGVFLFVAGCSMPLLTAFLSRYPEAVERVYAGRIGPFLSAALTGISSLFPFSLAEIGLLGLMSLTVILAARGVVQVARGRRHALNAAACGILRMAGLAGILLLAAYGAWGFNFARAGVVARLHWSDYASQPDSDSAREELTRYCTALVALANREFEAAAGTTDPGKPSTPRNSIAELDAAIEEAYARIGGRLNLHQSVASGRGPAKPVLTSFVMSALLIGGFYSPWTAEANYNRELPACNIPQTIAHEKAHQRGFPSEDEANFFGFLACIYARDPYVRYSGYLFAQQQLLGELRRFAPEKVKEIAGRRHPGIRRDVDFSRKFVERHRGIASDLSYAANNAYLEANRAPGGIKSYAMSSRLIVIYARAVDGTFESNTALR